MTGQVSAGIEESSAVELSASPGLRGGTQTKPDTACVIKVMIYRSKNAKEV